MPIYEMQTPDGVTYEVDAPNQQKALDALPQFQAQQSKQPQEVEKYNDGTIYRMPNGELSFTSPGFSTTNQSQIQNMMKGLRPDTPTFGVSEGAARAAFQGGTLNFGDELVSSIAAGIDPLRGKYKGTTYDDRYNAYLSRERYKVDRFKKTNPKTALAAEIAGGVALGAGAGGAEVTAARLIPEIIEPGLKATAARTGAALADGAAMNAAYAAGDGQNVLQNALTGALTGGVFHGVGGALSRLMAIRAASKVKNNFIKDAPTLEDLETEARNLYGLGRKTGASASPIQTKALAKKFKFILDDAGLISPKGRINNAVPKVESAFKHVKDYDGLPMSPTQMRSTRKAVEIASKSANKDEKRIGTLLKGELDTMSYGLVPEFGQVDKLYGRIKKAEDVDQLIDMSKTYATDNAVRNQFMKIKGADIQDKVKGYTPDELDALHAVANGGGLGEKALRFAAGAAPSSFGKAIVSGGVPGIMTGVTAGGWPGTLAGLGTVGLGAGAKWGAKKLQNKGAKYARNVILSGGVAPKLPKANLNALQRLMAERAAMGGVLAASPRNW